MKKNNNNIITFGCRLNSWESKKIEENISSDNKNNLIIVNTCAVTAEATKNAIKTIKKIKKTNNSKKIIVTGCSVEADFKKFAEMREVHQIVKNKDKLNSETWKKISPDNKNKDLIKKVAFKESPANSVIRRYIRIQNGCDHQCTFCIIPSCRGKSISSKSLTIIKEIKNLIKEGVSEIILTGVDITSWGQDFPSKPSLGKLVKEILHSVPNLKRLRLSSIDAAELDEELLKAIKTEKRLMPHLHFSLQSHDNIILKRMKRRHSSSDFENLIKKIREHRPDITLGADFITGFPTENYSMFKKSFDIIKKLNISHLHVFPYSEREGTIATRMPQNPIHIRRERARELRIQGNAILKKLLIECLGKKQKVLVENNQGFGKTEHYFLAKVKGAKKGEIVSFKPSTIENFTLLGEKL